jgi:hypothetical protein
LQERRVVGLRQRVIRRKGDEHADAALPLGLLRPRRKRPCRRRATEQRDELPPPQPGMGSLPGAASIIAASGRPKRRSFAAS